MTEANPESCPSNYPFPDKPLEKRYRAARRPELEASTAGIGQKERMHMQRDWEYETQSDMSAIARNTRASRSAGALPNERTDTHPLGCKRVHMFACFLFDGFSMALARGKCSRLIFRASIRCIMAFEINPGDDQTPATVSNRYHMSYRRDTHIRTYDYRHQENEFAKDNRSPFLHRCIRKNPMRFILHYHLNIRSDGPETSIGDQAYF